MLLVGELIKTSKVDPCLSSYNGTRPWPDKRNSQICESSVYNVALPFIVLSCYRSSVQTMVVFRPFQASNS